MFELIEMHNPDTGVRRVTLNVDHEGYAWLMEVIRAWHGRQRITVSEQVSHGYLAASGDYLRGVVRRSLDVKMQQALAERGATLLWVNEMTETEGTPEFQADVVTFSIEGLALYINPRRTPTPRDVPTGITFDAPPRMTPDEAHALLTRICAHPVTGEPMERPVTPEDVRALRMKLLKKHGPCTCTGQCLGPCFLSAATGCTVCAEMPSTWVCYQNPNVWVVAE